MDPKVTPASTRKPRPPALPFPDLPDAWAGDNAVFWRAAWLRDVAKHAALCSHNLELSARKKQPPAALWHALYTAQENALKTVRSSLKALVDAGGLLYAWIPEAPTQPVAKPAAAKPAAAPAAVAPPAVEPLLQGGRFGHALRYGPLRILGTANGPRWHRVCGGVAAVCRKATYRARDAA